MIVGTIGLVSETGDSLFCEQLLSARGYEVITAASGTETLEKAFGERPDIILLDVVMPAPDGYEVARILKADDELRYTPILLLTGKDELKDIIFGLDQGADDYVTKPYDAQELIARLHAAVRTRKLYSDLHTTKVANRQLQVRLKDQFAFGTIIGKSPVMAELYQVMAKVVDSDVPVLVTGESGTGKEMVAMALHANGQIGRAHV